MRRYALKMKQDGGTSMSENRILVTFAITGETADAYMDTHAELIYEDFVGRHNSQGIEFVTVKKSQGKL